MKTMKSVMNKINTLVLTAIVVVNQKSIQVHGAASSTQTVFCSDIVPPSSNEPSFEVCSIAFYTSPSPATFENGTTVYVGGYSSVYAITKGVSEGNDVSDSPDEYAGIGISVIRDDFDNCTVSVLYENTNVETSCDACTYCGDESYSVDCSNVLYGRSFDVCESTSEGIVFFPLTADALNITDGSQPTNNNTMETTGGGVSGTKPPKQKGGKKKQPANGKQGKTPKNKNVKGGAKPQKGGAKPLKGDAMVMNNAKKQNME